MAKFSACYQLCPLIDQKDFLGVTDESVNGCVILTLGKNMVIRYKLSDQKQVSCWSSREKLSAPVVYDAISQKYIGVFNDNQISTWEESCVQLNNLKKYKFAAPIQCVLTGQSSSTPVVVFRSGHIIPLQQALDRRKEPPPEKSLLEKDETICDAQLITLIGSVVAALFTKSLKGENYLHLIPLEGGLMTQSRLQLRRKTEDEVQLIGYTLVTYESCHLLTLWSDRQLFSLELPSRGAEQFPGRALTTLTGISPRHQTAMLALNSTHVAIYGARANEEGALLLIFNTQLYVRQCSLQFKLYTTPARLWAGGQQAVLVVTGQHVAVVPFYLGKQRLAALVGSQTPESAPPATLAVWQATAVKEEMDEVKPDTQPEMLQTIQYHMEEGLSQRMISQRLFPPALDSEDLEGLTTLLKNITDIPESCIIAVLSFCLKDIDTPGHKELLRLALSLPVTPDLTTLGLLRHKLKLGTVLNLLRQLCEAMLLTPGDPQLVEWATLLLDAYYQQYLLSRDPAVIEALTELKAIVDKQLEDMKVWQDLESLLLQLQNRQSLPDSSLLTNNTYSIDKITLY
uniref:Nucleolar protein 11 N-terminal domain-containing protein n=1 Tax=Graphocephala atropunctata TaxID=36148 RepID=A0A1B6LKA1_9HEMI